MELSEYMYRTEIGGWLSTKQRRSFANLREIKKKVFKIYYYYYYFRQK